MCLWLHLELKQSGMTADDKNRKCGEVAKSLMGNKHLACSQFSFSTDVRQSSYSNDHEQKSFTFRLYSVA